MRSPRLLVAWVILVFPVVAGAQERVLNAIERNGARIARTRMADQPVTVIKQRGFSVWVRPSAKVIGVSRGLRQQGFFLGPKGRLSSVDRVRLGRLIQRHAPGATASTVRRSMLGEIRQFKSRERTLRRQDPLIRNLLNKAAGAHAERKLWEGQGGAIYYRPQRNVLVGASSTSRTGFFLSKTKDGLSVQPRYLDGLRQFLHQRR